MLRTLTIATALAVLATPALAAPSVKISLVGKSADAVAAEIHKAARYVCRGVSSTPTFPHMKKDCIAATIAATHAKLAAGVQAQSTTLASR